MSITDIGIGVVVILAVIALGFLALTVAHINTHVKRHGIHFIVARALTGRPTNGKRYTTASFFRKSDGAVRNSPTGRVSKRHHRAGVSNLLRMLGWITLGIASLLGLTQTVTGTIIAVSIALTVFLGYKGVRLIVALRAWYVKRTFISPLAEGLGPRIGITGPELESAIHMDADYMTKKSGVIGKIDLPPRYHADGKEQESITSLINARLPVPTEMTFNYRGRTPHILIHAAPQFPSLVPFGHYREEIEKIGKGKYLAGITRSGDGYVSEFDGEDPHHGYCWGSGRGKSTILKSIIAQTFHNDPEATATVLDPKEVSLEALKGVPGITYYDVIEDFEGPRIREINQDNYEDFMPHMWHGAKSVYELMKSRYTELKQNPTKEFPVHLMVMEEANSFAVMSSIWWKKNKPKGMTAATPPIWAEYIAPIFWRGRQVNIKIVLVAQSIQERFLGSVNLRPSLGVISLSGYKANQWQNYIGTPFIKAQKGKGRAIYVVGDSETWVQTFLATDQEFRDFALQGRRELIIPDTNTVAQVNGGGQMPVQIQPGIPRGA
jgi:hypothetical protein